MRRFPILIPYETERRNPAYRLAPRSIRWDVIAPHEAQAIANHDQSLERLAARGGLSPCELIAVLEDRQYRPLPAEAAVDRLFEIIEGAGRAGAEEEQSDRLFLVRVERWLASHQPLDDEGVALLVHVQATLTDDVGDPDEAPAEGPHDVEARVRAHVARAREDVSKGIGAGYSVEELLAARYEEASALLRMDRRSILWLYSQWDACKARLAEANEGRERAARRSARWKNAAALFWRQANRHAYVTCEAAEARLAALPVGALCERCSDGAEIVCAACGDSITGELRHREQQLADTRKARAEAERRWNGGRELSSRLAIDLNRTAGALGLPPHTEPVAPAAAGIRAAFDAERAKVTNALRAVENALWPGEQRGLTAGSIEGSILHALDDLRAKLAEAKKALQYIYDLRGSGGQAGEAASDRARAALAKIGGAK